MCVLSKVPTRRTLLKLWHCLWSQSLKSILSKTTPEIRHLSCCKGAHSWDIPLYELSLIFRYCVYCTMSYMIEYTYIHFYLFYSYANSQGVVEEQYVFLKRMCQVLVQLGISQLAPLWVRTYRSVCLCTCTVHFTTISYFHIIRTCSKIKLVFNVQRHLNCTWT